jgi:CBS domain-containing protein
MAPAHEWASEAREASMQVKDVMTYGVAVVIPTARLDEAAEKLAGIVSIDDLAVDASAERLAGVVVREAARPTARKP